MYFSDVLPLHMQFPRISHLSVVLQSPTSPWLPAGPQSSHAAPDTTAMPRLSSAKGHTYCGMKDGGAATALHSFLQTNLPYLRHLKLLDLSTAPITAEAWQAVSSGLAPGRQISVRVHPDTSLGFTGRTWVDKLSSMLGALHHAKPLVHVEVADSGLCWCDIEAERGLKQVRRQEKKQDGASMFASCSCVNTYT